MSNMCLRDFEARGMARGEISLLVRALNSQPSCDTTAYIDPYNKNFRRFTAWTHDNKMILGETGNVKVKGESTCHWDFGIVPGDTLMCKESFCEYVPEHVIDKKYVYKADSTPDSEQCRKDYIECGYPYQWKSPAQMPPEAVRFKPTVKEVWVKRISELTTVDAVKMGFRCDPIIDGIDSCLLGEKCDVYFKDIDLCNGLTGFRNQWNADNKKYPYESNCWIYGVELEAQE